MAAVYLHNATFSQNNPAPHDIQEHSRNISTISSATLATNTTLHSQPTEPLLNTNTYPTAPDTNTHFPATFPPPQNSAGLAAHLRWGDPPVFNTHSSLNEKDQWQGVLRKPTRRRRTATLLLEVLMVVWCIYTTVRYFIAFTIYDHDSPAGQEFSFALGTCSGLAFALTLCSHGIFFVKHQPSISTQAFKYLTRTCFTLRYISSLLILGPAIVNFVLIFLWRNSSNPRLNLHNRCHRVPVDIVWSVPRNPCFSRASPWGVWLTLSSIRLGVTSIILIAYHVLSYVPPIFPEPPLHHRLRSESYPSTALNNSEDGISSAAITFPVTPVRERELSTQRQNSDSTLKDSYRPPSRLGRTRSQSSGVSDETIAGKSMPLGQRVSPPESAIEHQDHFQSLLSQINQETDDAMNFASSDRSSSPATGREQVPSPTPSHPPGLQSSFAVGNVQYDSSDDDDNEQFHVNHDNIYNLPPVPPVLGYNEFGMPYPPDQDMRILNGYIRRMPTIESMGSGEIAMSGASNRLGGSIYTSSRPPTRNTLLSFTSSMDHEISASAPPSRPNSLSARVELLVGMFAMNTNGMTEHGELQGRHEIAPRRLSNPISFIEYPDSVNGVTGDTYSSGGSRASYHTATMGSTGDALPSASISLHPSSAMT